jgi:isopenicillin N synthase-like dioxygenase
MREFMNKNTLPGLELPNFNISEFERGDNLTKDAMRESLRKCCKEHGFFSISGHGVLDKIKEDAIGVTRKFFKLPLECRKKYFRKYKFLNTQRGYNEREFYEANPFLDGSPTDINETYLIGRSLTPQQKQNMTEEGKIMLKIYGHLNCQKCKK